jgi:hypothetical protein
MKSLITVLMTLTTLAGCVAGPKLDENTAVVDLPYIYLKGDPSGPWAGHHLRLGLGKDHASWYGGSVAVPAGETLRLRAYAAGHWLDNSFADQIDVNSRWALSRPYYPFDIKGEYGEGNTYVFGPFQPNKCYVAYIEPVPVTPYTEPVYGKHVHRVVGQRNVRYEFETRADVIDCETVGDHSFEHAIF